MSRAEQVQTLREIFERAKLAPRDKEGCFEDLHLRGEVFHALICAGRDQLTELRDYVYEYITDPYEDFRSEAVESLGWDTGFNDKEFQKNEAYQIWLNDPSEDVRRVALVAWARYHAFSKNPMVIKYLYNIFRSDKYSFDIRSCALSNFIHVADAQTYPREIMDILELGEIEDKKTFLASMDWGKINRIMDQYVPNWRK